MGGKPASFTLCSVTNGVRNSCFFFMLTSLTGWEEVGDYRPSREWN